MISENMDQFGNLSFVVGGGSVSSGGRALVEFGPTGSIIPAPAGVERQLNFNSVIFDSRGEISGNEYIPSSDGYYCVYMSAQIDDLTPVTKLPWFLCKLKIKRNGSVIAGQDIVREYLYSASVPYISRRTGSAYTFFELSASDSITFHIEVFYSASTGQLALIESPARSYASVFKLSAV